MSRTYVYEAEPRRRVTGSVHRRTLQGFIEGRHAALRLFLRDLKTDYTVAALGAFWDFIGPAIMVLVFIFLKKYKPGLAEGVGMPYPVYVCFGYFMWVTFTESLRTPLALVRANKSLIQQTQVYPESLIGSQLLRLGFNASFRVAAMLAIAAALGSFTVGWMLLFLLLFPLIILCGYCIGILLAPLNVIYNDLSRLISVILTPMLWASPIMYSISESSILYRISVWNPPVIVLSNLRLLANAGRLADPVRFAVMAMASVAAFWFGCVVFRLAMPVVAARI